MFYLAISRRTALLLGVLSVLPGCGAGLIGGISANQNANGTAEARPPGLSLTPTAVLPLVPPANSTRTVVVTNAQVPASARLRVTIAAKGVTVDQVAPTIAGQGGSTAITFTIDTGLIVKAVSDPTVSDVPAQLTVLVDDRPVAASVPILLARQPKAEIVLGTGQQEFFVSPFGQLATLHVTGLQNFDVANLQMFVATRDPQNGAVGAPPTLIRACTNLAAVATAVPGEATVSATVPGNSFPDMAHLFVRDAVSGQSTNATVYYRPEISLALPSKGLTTGGNLVTLIGTALVPYDFTQSPAVLSYGAVTLSFARGLRVSTLARADLRDELSAGDRLVFRMPPSPDGRPGQVDIVLQVAIAGKTAQSVASQVFLYANPHPFFGPRGAVLDQQPVAVAPIALDAAPSGGDAPDFAVLTEEGGAGFLQLLLAQENGMFLRFGARRQIGDHEVAAERNPRDICAADFEGDGVPDMFILNAGGGTAVHHMVMGQARPATPLGDVFPFAGDPGMARCRVADFDGDGQADLLLVPGAGAPALLKPQVWLARPVDMGPMARKLPAFAPPISLPVRDFAYEAVEIADLDGDGFLDVALVDGPQQKLDVAYGNGNGTFTTVVSLDFAVPGYTPDPGSPAVGVHASGNRPLQSLTLVLGGDDDGAGADPDPVLAVFHQPTARVHASPVASDVRGLGPDPVAVSLMANLDGPTNSALEVCVAIRGALSDPLLPSIGLLRFNGTNFDPVSGGVEIGGEQPGQFRALQFGRAFPATQLGEALAVFAVHESQIDGSVERRLSTLLLYGSGATLAMLAPDAGGYASHPCQGLIGGNWTETSVSAEGSVRDLAVAYDGGVDVLVNDGFGGQPVPGGSLVAAGLLPSTLQLLASPVGQFERLVFLDQRSRFGVWLPTPLLNQNPNHLSQELRANSPTVALRTALLTDLTRVAVADVDGDGVDDLVALLRFNIATPGQGDALLALMRGKGNPAPTENPFYAPTVLLPVHGKATSFALGDFAAALPSQPRQLELVLAVPEPTQGGGLDGDHILFYRYVAGATPDLDHFEPSFLPNGPRALLAGSRPTRVAAADFDRDGLVDLLVAAAGDHTLRLFRNVALPAMGQGHVDVGAFFESLSSPRTLAPGTPTKLRLGDVNGDGAIDAIVAVQSLTSASQKTTAVAFYLSDEPGVFGDAQFVSPTRTGNRDQVMALDLGDWNRDGVLDLFIGWSNSGQGNRNVRVLFGGSR